MDHSYEERGAKEKKDVTVEIPPQAGEATSFDK